MNSIWAPSVSFLLMCLTAGCIVTGQSDTRTPLELTPIVSGTGMTIFESNIDHESLGSMSEPHYLVMLESAGEDSSSVLLERKVLAIGTLATLESGEFVKAPDFSGSFWLEKLLLLL